MVFRTKLVITIVAVFLVVIAYTGTIDGTGLDYTESAFKRTLITYGIARGLNGVISVAQGTELAVEPVGIGLTFAPGEILDPVNDLIERFSWIVLASGTSLGIQRVLINITQWNVFTFLVAACVLLALCMLWTGKGKWEGAILRPFSYKLALVLLLLRFAVPLIALTGEGVYGIFLAPIYERSTEQLQAASLTLKDLNQQTQSDLQQPESDSLLENARQKLLSLTRQINIDERLEQFTEAAEFISENAINLMVIFVLQTLILPLFFAWLILQLLKWIITSQSIA